MRFGWTVVFTFAFLSGCLDDQLSIADVTNAAARGLTCENPCDVALGSTGFGMTEPVAAVNPSNKQHIVVGSMGRNTEKLTATPVGDVYARSFMEGLWSHVTFDGGATWRAVRLPGGPGERQDHPLFAYNGYADPQVQILSNGTVVYGGLALHRHMSYVGPNRLFTTMNVNLFVARSFDGGLTWPEVRILARGISGFTNEYYPAGPVIYPDYPGLARGADETLVVVWHEITWPGTTCAGLFVHVSVLAMVSPDGGATWGPASKVLECVTFGGITITPDGVFHAAYQDARGVWHAQSSDKGLTWTQNKIGPTSTEVSLASDSRGNLFLADAIRTEDGRETPILRHSLDGGVTWSDPVALDEPEAPGTILPTVAVDGRDIPYVSFYHAMPVNETRWFELRVVRASPEDGTVNGTASRQPFSTSAPFSADRRGDYMGLAGLPDGVFAAWAGGGAASNVQIRGSRVV